MRKKTVCLIIIQAMMLLNIPVALAETYSIYVSPAGNDSNDGSIDSPIKSLEKAKKMVQDLNDGNHEIEVILREGTYRFDDTLTFTAADSGSEKHQIVYKAYDGEKVEIKGSVEIDASKAKRVTDSKIIARLHDAIANKIVEIDLTSQGITSEMMKSYVSHASEHTLSGGELNGLYQNQSAQTVAEWPNGFNNYTTWDYAETNSSIHYTDVEPKRWTEAKYMILGGYCVYDYAYSRKTVESIDTENRIINCTSGGSHGFTNPQSRRWKMFNLLEEIDVPGEYYIDPDEMKLYWYPESNLSNSTVEFSWLRKPLLSFDSASNIKFEGITFSQTLSHAITMKQVRNVDFVNCNIKDIGARGIYVYSDIQAQNDKDYWQRTELDASYDCDILGCSFDNIGHSAIYMNGGSVDTLTSSNNRIENNIITRTSQLAKNFPAIWICGVGISVQNNNISKLPFHAINIRGNDHVIKYNEIYDSINESDDCGVIYAGRNTIDRGTEIAYNYIHDYSPVKELVYNFQGGIYLDDSLGGFKIHHNIIKGGNIDLIVNGGVDIDYSYNTAIDIKRYHTRFINGGIAANANTDKGIWEGYIADENLFFEHYPHLKELLEIGKVNRKDERLAKFNIIRGNFGVNTAKTEIGSNTLKYGKVSDNIDVEKCDDFVDAENQDYRIKLNSPTYKLNSQILNENFDIDSIGLTRNIELNEETSGFKQLYPANGQKGLGYSSVTFNWQKAYGANVYKIVIATDSQLKNVVCEETVHDNVVDVTGLSKNTVYYWKVYAVNISREIGNTWESNSPVFCFSTGIYEKLNVEYLNEDIKNIQSELSKLDVGENPGQYSEKVVKQLESIIAMSQKIANSRTGTVSQEIIDRTSSQLSNYLNKIGMTNLGYIDMSKYMYDESKWSAPIQINSDSSIELNQAIAGKNTLGMSGLDYMSGSVLYSLEAKLNVGSFVVLGENKDVKSAPYNAANTGYSFLFKKNSAELHVCSGSTHEVVETIDCNIGSDGKFHKIEYGYITTDIGNIVLLFVDGEMLMRYLDVVNTAVNSKGSFNVHMYSKNDSITLRAATQDKSAEDLQKIIRESVIDSAQIIANSYSTTGEIIALPDDGRYAFSKQGIYDLGEPIRTIDSTVMMPCSAVEKVFGTPVVYDSGVISLKYNDTDISFVVGENCYYVGDARVNIQKGAVMYNSSLMIPVEALLTAMNRQYTHSNEEAIIVVGDIIFMNNITQMHKTNLLLKSFEKYADIKDYKFE